MAINRNKLAALVLGGMALLWLVALFVGLPYLMSKKITALVGQDLPTVERELGTPTRQWTPTQFECDPSYPCKERSVGGPVYLYADREKMQGWYLFFDDKARLAKLEPVGIDAGTR